MKFRDQVLRRIDQVLEQLPKARQQARQRILDGEPVLTIKSTTEYVRAIPKSFANEIVPGNSRACNGAVPKPKDG